MCTGGPKDSGLSNLNLNRPMQFATISDIDIRPATAWVITIIHLLIQKIIGPIGVRRSRRKAVRARYQAHNPIDLLPYVAISGPMFTRHFQGKSL